MSTISTHVLDTALGRPATGIRVHIDDSQGATLGTSITDADGRARDLLPDGGSLGAGVYRLRLDVAEHFARDGRDAFYPEIVVVFRIGERDEHYHVPVLLGPYGYTTYRGS